MEIFGIFGMGVMFGCALDLCLQLSFKLFLGARLKKNYAYHLFQDVNVFVPALAGVVMLFFYGSNLSLKIFFVSALLGTFLEYLVGRALCSMHGRPIWEYKYLPLGKYTSWVSLLYWGGVGLLFVRVASLIQKF